MLLLCSTFAWLTAGSCLKMATQFLWHHKESVAACARSSGSPHWKTEFVPTSNSVVGVITCNNYGSCLTCPLIQHFLSFLLAAYSFCYCWGHLYNYVEKTPLLSRLNLMLYFLTVHVVNFYSISIGAQYSFCLLRLSRFREGPLQKSFSFQLALWFAHQ